MPFYFDDYENFVGMDLRSYQALVEFEAALPPIEVIAEQGPLSPPFLPSFLQSCNHPQIRILKVVEMYCLDCGQVV